PIHLLRPRHPSTAFTSVAYQHSRLLRAQFLTMDSKERLLSPNPGFSETSPAGEPVRDVAEDDQMEGVEGNEESSASAGAAGPAAEEPEVIVLDDDARKGPMPPPPAPAPKRTKLTFVE